MPIFDEIYVEFSTKNMSEYIKLNFLARNKRFTVIYYAKAQRKTGICQKW